MDYIEGLEFTKAELIKAFSKLTDTSSRNTLAGIIVRIEDRIEQEYDNFEQEMLGE